jgi:hypothetical protein
MGNVNGIAREGGMAMTHVADLDGNPRESSPDEHVCRVARCSAAEAPVGQVRTRKAERRAEQML